MRVDKPVSAKAQFGHELRRLRERAGLTQVQLAGRLGYDHTYISKLDSGDRVPRFDFASRADDVLGAEGGLIAVASSTLASRFIGGSAGVACGPVVTPLPGAAVDRLELPPPLMGRPTSLRTCRVACATSPT